MRTENLMEYAPEGSDIYYVLRQVPDAQKSAYLAVHAFAMELYKISENYRAVNIAQQKLAWWCEEIKRLYQGIPTHPISKTLSPDLKLYDLKEIEFLAMLEGAMLSTTTQIFATESELRQHYQHLGGILATLKAKVLSRCVILGTPQSGVAEDPVCNSIAQRYLHQLGIIQEILRHLLEFPKFLQRQYLYLPLSAFQQDNLDPQPILQGKNLITLTPLLHNELHQAEKLLVDTLSQLNKSQKKAFRPLILEVKLKLKQAQKTASNAWQIFDYRLELSPLMKLFFTELSK